MFPIFIRPGTNRWFSRYVIAAKLVDAKQKIALFVHQHLFISPLLFVSPETARKPPIQFEFSFVGNDRQPLQKSGTRRENRNAPDSPD